MLSTDEMWKYIIILNEGEVSSIGTTKYKGNSENLTGPTTIDNLLVRRIEFNSFENCTSYSPNECTSCCAKGIYSYEFNYCCEN